MPMNPELRRRQAEMFRRLEKPKRPYALAKTPESGMRFWNPKRTTDNHRVSFPFEVLLHGGPTRTRRRVRGLCALYGITVEALELSRPFLGTGARYVVQLWHLSQKTANRVALVFHIHGRDPFPDKKTALRRGGACATTLYEQLRTNGIDYHTTRRRIREQLADDRSNRNADTDQWRDQSEDWTPEGRDDHSTAPPGADSVPADD